MSLLVDDRNLLKRFRASEPAAMREVFLHYMPALTRQLRRGFSFRTNSKTTGRTVRFEGYSDTFQLEDALQEIFRRAFSEKARLSYDGLRPYAAWLNTIAKNVVINDFQSKRKYLENFAFDAEIEAHAESEWSAADDALPDMASPASGNPERDLETAELRGLVAAYRKTLNERENAVFELRFVESLAHPEIEKRSGISPSKIKTTEAKMRVGLARFLKSRGYLEHEQKSQEKNKTPFTSWNKKGEKI